MTEVPITIPITGDFDPKDTFECGQCFRWEQDEKNGYVGVVEDRVARIEVIENDDEEKSLHIEEYGLKGDRVSGNDKEDFWHNYLDLGTDYCGIKAELIKEDPKMEEIILSGKGIHLLNQDPWETLISFIISQNNHIPRIKKCVESLCALFGEPLGFHFQKEHYGFPSPIKIASLTEADLAPIKLGYRLPYLLKAARMVVEDGESRLSSCNKKGKEEGMDKATGKKATASISNVTVANVEDWDKFHAFVKKTGYFHLLQRRVSDPGFRELLEQKGAAAMAKVGVVPFVKQNLNLTTLK